MGPAEAILSTINVKSAAWQTAQAAKERRATSRSRSLAQLGQFLGEFPTLLQKGAEERETKSVQEAFNAGFAEGGWDKGLETALSVPTRYSPGEAMKYNLSLDATKWKSAASKAAIEDQNTRELMKQRSEESARRAEEDKFQKGRRSALATAMQPESMNLTLPAPFAPGGTEQLGIQRNREPMEAQQRFLGSGYATPEDNENFIQEQNKLKVAMDTQSGLARRADETNQIKRETLAAANTQRLIALGLRKHGLDLQEKRDANGQANAEARLAQSKINDAAVLELKKEANAIAKAGALSKENMATNRDARLAASDQANRATNLMGYLLREREAIPKRDFSDTDTSAEEAWQDNERMIEDMQSIIDTNNKALSSIIEKQSEAQNDEFSSLLQQFAAELAGSK